MLANILLDTFPYGGCTTIFESLIMSTPVVTLVGDKWCNRYGYSYLSHLGLTKLIAYSLEEFVNIVYNLSKERLRLNQYHTYIGKIIRNSNMCNKEIFMKDYENLGIIRQKRNIIYTIYCICDTHPSLLFLVVYQRN